MIYLRHTIIPSQCFSKRNNLSKLRYFSQIKSSPSTATTADDITQLSGIKTCDNTPAIFPWRHSNELIPRVDPKSIGYNPHGPIISMKWSDAFFAYVVSSRLLGASWWDILISNKWEHELCSNFTWAFGRSVAGLISHTFHIPIDYVEKHEETSVAQHDIHVDYESSSNNNDKIVEEEKEEKLDNKNGSKNIEKTTKTNDINLDDLAKNMLEENLLELYTNTAKHTSKPNAIKLKLQTRPISAHLISTNIMVYSRKMVRKEPEIKGLWKKPTDELISYIYENYLLLFSNDAEFTIICQAVINCKEIFWVKNENTGEVIQGEESDIEKDVVHLVRFEMPCKYSDNNSFSFRPGSWVIVDWDDLLKGNIYF